MKQSRSVRIGFGQLRHIHHIRILNMQFVLVWNSEQSLMEEKILRKTKEKEKRIKIALSCDSEIGVFNCFSPLYWFRRETIYWGCLINFS